MSKHSTNYATRGSGAKQHVRPGSDATTRPIIDWAALWSRLWLVLKRLVAEIWYLISRTRPVGLKTRTKQSNHRLALGFNWRRWSWPMLKVGVLAGLFIYVMQRDIQFSIQMRAPSGQTVAWSTDTPSGAQAEQMGFAQTVSFGGKKSGTLSVDPAQLGQPAVENYLERFAQVAQAEMQKYGIPASIKMAQAILESQAGQSVTAKVDNNHFGQPLAGQPFESAWRNWREHSLLLINRYQQLLPLGKDYRAWARGLQKANYNNNPNYANDLLEIIDRFHLEQLDDPTI